MRATTTSGPGRLLLLSAMGLAVWLGAASARGSSDDMEGMEGMEDGCGAPMQWMVGWCMDDQAAPAMESYGLAAAATMVTAAAVTPIDVPGASATRAYGINARGDVVGSYTDSMGTHGYLLREGAFTAIDYPGAVVTEAWGINARGDVVGRYRRPGSGRTFGFLLSGGRYTDISVGNHLHTLPTRIGASGEIVGCFHGTNSLADMRGDVQRGRSVYASERLSSSMHNGVTPGARAVVGLAFETATRSYGYVIEDDVLTRLDFPGSTFTQAWDVSPSGTIVGLYNDASGATHGFVHDGSGFATLDVPGASSTRLLGIGPQGAIVGVYTDGAGMHGFRVDN